jgi:TonB family protein
VQIPQAFGGGEVVVELTIDSRGAVTQVERVRVTPPYADLVADSAAEWRFEPATVVLEGRATAVAASVLIVAVFRPASFYSGPAPGVPPQVLGAPSPRVPRVESIVMPAYPPMATGDGIVLVEVEMSGRAEPRNYRIVGSRSGFDAAALDAVRAWRFGAPETPVVADPLFVYAVVGFRAPLVPVTPRRE